MDLILASKSPRRKQLMEMIYNKDQFRVIKSDIRELVPRDLAVEQCPEYLAKEKAESIAKGYSKALVIGCDTSVIMEGKILNKPRSTSDAREMMEMLSGKTHYVVTGCALCYLGQTHTFSETTEVEFYEITPDEIEEYIATTEPYDKAGGYGIQSIGALFVKRISGDYYNVVGMPIARLKREIDTFLDQDFPGEEQIIIKRDKPKAKI